MPELPEVETTVRGINKVMDKLSITDVWTNYSSEKYLGKNCIKNPEYFKIFKEECTGMKFIQARRMAKNILIDIEGRKTIHIHMKMTGHILYGQYRKTTKSEYEKTKELWTATNDILLESPFNRFIRLVFTLSNGKHLVLSDMRKFAQVSLISNQGLDGVISLAQKLGPEPLEKGFTAGILKTQLQKRSRWMIKKALLDQEIISGIGNIYGDEILWQAKISPERMVKDVTLKEFLLIHKAIQDILPKSIAMGGDSMSDYRNIYGEKGKFQNFHKAYRQTGKLCQRKSCAGIIKRITIAQRSAHFCQTCQN